MFFATAMWFLSVSMFFSSRGLIFSLSEMSGKYLAASSEVMKAAYLATAAQTIATNSMYAYMALTLLSAASIITGIVMLKSSFGKIMGYLVMGSGIFTLFTPLGVIMKVPLIISFIGLVLTGVWQLIVGAKLYKLGRAA